MTRWLLLVVPLLFVAPLLAAGYGAPAFQFDCTATAARIQGTALDQKTYSSITVWNATCDANGLCSTGSTAVFLGGEFNSQGGVVTAVTKATGMPICNDDTKCIAPWASLDVNNLQCITASGTVEVLVQVVR